MSEHQVVIVFDVTAETLIEAGLQVRAWLGVEQRRGDFSVESWWMPEEPLRTEVDGNDNAAGRLVFDIRERTVAQAAQQVLDAYDQYLDSDILDPLAVEIGHLREALTLAVQS